MKSKKRPGVTGIHSLDRFVFSVPDLGAARDYFTAFGLDVRDAGGHLDLYTYGHPHRWGSVYQSGQPKRLEYLTLGVFEEDYEPLQHHLRKLGIASADPHPLVDSQGFWLRDPDGILLQIAVAEKCAPDQKGDAYGPLYVDNPIGVKIGPKHSTAPQVRPIRLTHALFFCTDVPRSVRFYEDALGMRLSDHSGEVIAFMHGPHSSDHHLLAFAKADTRGLHHTSWVVRGIDEIGLGAEQMKAAGYDVGWGVGRHVVGSNYFCYIRDPWGSFTEYSYDIDFIGAETEWPALNYPPEDALSLWGPPPPADFIVNHEKHAP